MATNAELLSRRDAAIPAGAATAHPVFVALAQGSEIWDVEGKHYIDFASGIAVNNVGSLHSDVIEAVKSQLDRYAHVGFPVAGYEPYIRVCEQLNARAPIQDAQSVLFSTGAEATENAIKVARLHTGRHGVITFTGSFHGRTQLAMAMTGKVAPLRTGVPPSQAGVVHIPFPVPHHGTTAEDSLRALDFVFRSTLSPDQIAAIVIEPVQGEGGFYQAPVEFVRRLRSLCDQHGICFVADEVQSGFGRTGRFFAIEHYDVEPDLIPVGKALGGGLPLAGLIGKKAVFKASPPGALGGTFAGNPVACSAALSVFDIIDRDRLLERAQQVGQFLLVGLTELKSRKNVLPIGDVRGLGAMVAFELVMEHGGHTPDADAAKRVAERARQNGLLLLPCGYWGNTIRLSAPLNCPDEILRSGLARLAVALSA